MSGFVTWMFNFYLLPFLVVLRYVCLFLTFFVIFTSFAIVLRSLAIVCCGTRSASLVALIRPVAFTSHTTHTSHHTLDFRTLFLTNWTTKKMTEMNEFICV